METPKIADLKPMAVELEAQEYYWCACGLSQNQPFCDGSHAGTRFNPQAFTPDEPGQAYLCMCKQSANPPYCDGTHASLSPESVTEPVETQPAKTSAGTTDAMPKPRNTAEEPTVELIHALATDGLTKTGHHGEMDAMGVPRPSLPEWDDIQILTAQLAKKPLLMMNRSAPS